MASRQANGSRAIEEKLLKRIERSWSRKKDNAQPKALEVEIQFQLGCSYGRAITEANAIRLRFEEI